jgi:CheY-like chemotaxis protein
MRDNQSPPRIGTFPVVLVVVGDDERRATYAYALSAIGFGVIATGDPVAWCASGSHESPDIVIVDVSDPRGDGWRVVQRVKREPCMRDIPLVALAAQAGGATRERAQREGCAAVCVDTCPAELIARGLRAVLATNNAKGLS